MSQLRNTDMVGVWIGGLIGLLGLVVAVMPGVTGMDMMETGYGLVMIGIFILSLGVIIAMMFGQRARVMNRILAGNEILARWTFTEVQGQQQVESEFTRLKGLNQSLFLIMLAWFVVIGGGFLGMSLLTKGDILWGFALPFFGILVVLGMVAFFAPIIWRIQAQRASREVIISRKGMVLNGALHTWIAPFNKLTGVQFHSENAGQAMEFKIRTLSRASMAGYRVNSVLVPVPYGQEEAAHRVVATLTK